MSATVSFARCDSATTVAGSGLIVDDDVALRSANLQEWSHPRNPGRKGQGLPRSSRNSSAVRRHFAQYESQNEMNDEIELGWDCGICFETAEDPCVTRCGHLYCQSHLNHWLSSHASCPVCKSMCTPPKDVVPIFSRGRTSPTPSPSSSPRISPSPSPSPSPTPTAPRRSVPGADEISARPDLLTSISPPPPFLSTRSSLNQDHIAPSAPHPLLTSYVLVYYLGIALRVLGLAILLAVLLR